MSSDSSGEPTAGPDAAFSDFSVLEGVVTTTNPDGSPHVAAMGPLVNGDLSRFVLRPFVSTTTYANLARTGRCVAHVTDDVELVARGALGLWEQPPLLDRTPDGNGWLLRDACRWYALEVEPAACARPGDPGPRAAFPCRVTDRGTLRDFFGLSRAKHAVIEATILATRLAIAPQSEALEQIDRLRPLVEKTASPSDRRAFHLVEAYVRGWRADG